MAKKIYWTICILAGIISAVIAPMYVDYEWGVGAYIAIAWLIFILIFGLIGIFADKIKSHYDKKS